MHRISLPVTHLRHRYDVIVVGSGYGGGIAASRFARAGRRVCILERGREFLPGDFPNHELSALTEIQLSTPGVHLGSRSGLYEVHVDEDITVVKGCGLGGTSLVNANVALRAEPRVFADPRWPAELRADLEGGIEAGYQRAEAMLRPRRYPSDRPELRKVAYLRAAAAKLGERCDLTPINVTFEDGVNHVGVEQKACNDCGDCVTGCNHAAKNTTRMNYLPDAWNHGAEIFCEIDVRHVRRGPGGWQVVVQPMHVGRDAFEAPSLFISADLVVLGAGSLGSTEILLRSAASGGVPLSPQVGRRFTGNGDVLGFAYNGKTAINAIGWADNDPGEAEPVGPCITAVIDARGKPRLEDGMVIQDGAMPGPVAGLAAQIFPHEMVIQGAILAGRMLEDLPRKARELESQVRGPRHGAMQNTQSFLVMAHDDDAGRMRLKDDALRISWEGVGKQPIFKTINETLARAAQTTEAAYIRNPTWSKLLGQPLVTVHPLGGCCMGDDAGAGVVNHDGQVYAGEAGEELHPGLYVMDGAIIPTTLGVNPLLTISAVAERCADLAIRQHGWDVSYALPSRPSQDPAPAKVGVRFTETMKGHFSRGDLDYAAADAQGRTDDSPFRFVLTIASDDLEDLMVNEHHTAHMLGTVEAPALSPDPLTVTGGRFNLFINNPDQPGTKNMIYRMGMTARDGARYWFEGFKVVRDDPGMDGWSDTTTLYVTVWSGEDTTGALVGRGILRIAPDDFARQVTTMKVTGAPGRISELADLLRFGRYFMGSLWQTYGFKL